MQELIELILKDIETIPPFIDGKIHLIVWREMQKILYCILELVEPEFLAVDILIEVDVKIIQSLIVISERVSKGFYRHINSYFRKKINYYYQYALNNELFEVVQNIKTIQELNDE